MSDDRQRLRREAVEHAGGYPPGLWVSKVVLAMESLLVEAEELKEGIRRQERGARARAEKAEARVRELEASAEEAHRDAASLRLRIERLVAAEQEEGT